ncbi:PREDICTED: WAT1-related protein At3g28050-like isoform X1 [Ipomoea nil]|uniref:WAT1-related protein At3g28050-like isoform X1 n=1 Tax=Ipomoea nil TaxID=35883 RepID=UPI000901BF3D|nr:PREDICTED: WAT1-related protein At3g28050-like isoform X1 [Ipomoea nil]
MAMGREILRKEVLPFVAMIVVVCMQMATTTIAKAVLNSGLSSLIYVVYYNSLGVLLLLPGFIIQRHRRHARALTLSVLRRCFVVGLLGTCALVLGNQGLNYSSPTLSAGISNLMPGFTFVLAMIFRMEKFEVKRRTWQAKSVGTLVSIIGASIMTLYQGPTILGSSSTSDLPHQHSLLSHEYFSRWVVGGVMLVATYLFASGWSILQTATLKDYQEQITIVFFSTCFGSIQSAIVSLLLERKLDAWKLQPGIGMTAIVASAVLEPLCNQNITAFCLNMKGPLYVAMFKPLGVVIAAILNLLFLADALHLGSIIGSIIVIVGFYVVMWGMSRQPLEILRESEAANESSHLLQK